MTEGTAARIMVSATQAEKAELKRAAMACGVRFIGAYILMQALKAARAEAQ